MATAATVLKQHKSKLMEAWVQQAEEKVLAAGLTNTLALRDHLPNLLDHLADVLDENSGQPISGLTATKQFERIRENSSEHGRHRASTQAYTIEQILHEYIILHQLTIQLLAQHAADSPEVLKTVAFTYENAMRQAAEAFTTSLEELHEKLIATFVHDLRNPLANAQLATSLLEGTLAEQRSEKLLNMVKISLEKSMGLVADLTEMVTAQAGAGLMVYFEEGKYQTPAQSVYRDSRRIYSQPIKLNCPPEPLKGVLDETALRRTLESLVTNAVKYSKGEGSIELSLEEAGHGIQYRVLSTGWHLSPQKQEEINQFLRGQLPQPEDRNSYLGKWGMNLALVKAIVEVHKGSVSCSSGPEGTSFLVEVNPAPSKAGKVRTSLSKAARQRQ